MFLIFILLRPVNDFRVILGPNQAGQNLGLHLLHLQLTSFYGVIQPLDHISIQQTYNNSVSKEFDFISVCHHPFLGI